MNTFEVTVLGNSSALPAFGRNPSSQLINAGSSYFLIDCGEGTQMQLRRYSIRFQRISRIFISHLHGDHYLGLPGLLSSLHLLGHTNPMHIYSPPGLQQIIELGNKQSDSHIQYPIIYHVLNTSETEVLNEDKNFLVRSIPMKHTLPCCGFVIEEKQQPGKFIKEELAKFQIPYTQLQEIRMGKDYVTPKNEVIPNSQLVIPPPPPRKYSYCSDTQYNEDILPFIMNSDLLYHEATFMEDLRERALQTLHSTGKDAATIAIKSHSLRLIIGHFSARYKDLEPLLKEAREIFPSTFLAEEGVKVVIESQQVAAKG